MEIPWLLTLYTFALMLTPFFPLSLYTIWPLRTSCRHRGPFLPQNPLHVLSQTKSAILHSRIRLSNSENWPWDSSSVQFPGTAKTLHHPNKRLCILVSCSRTHVVLSCHSLPTLLALNKSFMSLSVLKSLELSSIAVTTPHVQTLLCSHQEAHESQPCDVHLDLWVMPVSASSLHLNLTGFPLGWVSISWEGIPMLYSYPIFHQTSTLHLATNYQGGDSCSVFSYIYWLSFFYKKDLSFLSIYIFIFFFMYQ